MKADADHSQTFRLLTDDEKSVVDPGPTMLKILVQSESKQIFGIHVIGRQAAEIVNLASVAIRCQLTLEQLLKKGASSFGIYYRCWGSVPANTRDGQGNARRSDGYLDAQLWLVGTDNVWERCEADNTANPLSYSSSA
jgi:Pyridine nucleotide-disulphide oxidoreductase, dimerisation domain